MREIVLQEGDSAIPSGTSDAKRDQIMTIETSGTHTNPALLLVLLGMAAGLDYGVTPSVPKLRPV